MARQESDREDLLREATALVERVELAPVDAGDKRHVVMGFRPEGAMSIYFGDDAAFHFNSRGQLRRAFASGLLYKAEHGRLIALERTRSENEVQLLRRSMSDEEQAAFVAEMLTRLRELVRQCNQNEFVTVGQVPSETDVLSHTIGWLSQMNDATVARSPRVR